MLVDELVVNYHITARCNYSCQHCYANWASNNTQEIHRDMTKVKRLLNEIYPFFSQQSKTLRLNLAGGEPLLCKNIGKIIELAHAIGFRVSLISNGSALTHKFILNNAKQLAMVGLSIDSLQPARLKKIGRLTRNGQYLSPKTFREKVSRLREVNDQLQIKFNTVVCQFNYDEYFGDFIDSVRPDKWKIFRVLPFAQPETAISDDEFSLFLNNHRDIVTPHYIENNDDMIESYIMVDPIGRFYQNSTDGHYTYSQPITEVGAENAFNQINFSPTKYSNRYQVRQHIKTSILTM
jgi:radical S-adenosyl methionine domain-containing protein 2